MQESQIYDSFTQGLQKLFSAIMKYYKQKKELKDPEQALLNKFLKGHGAVYASNVHAEDAAAIKKELVRQGIPFMPMPGQNGEIVLLVRQSYIDKLIAVEEYTFAQSTKYTKELETKNAIRAMRNVGINSSMDYAIHKDISEIAKQKLFQSGITFSEHQPLDDPKKSHFLVFPNSVYKENGKDMEYFKLNYALLQSKTSDMFLTKEDIDFNKELKKKLDNKEITLEEYLNTNKESELIKVRKQQAKYDKEQILRFINEARLGKEVVLANNKKADNHILMAKDGKIYAINRMKGTKTEIKYFQNDNSETIYQALSRHTEKIYNMTVIPTEIYQQNLDNPPFLNSNMLETSGQTSRPELKDHKALGKIYGKQFTYDGVEYKGLESYIEQINEKATKIVNEKYKNASTEKKAEYKNKEMLELLKDRKSEPYVELVKMQNYLDKIPATESLNVNIETLHDEIVQYYEMTNRENEYELVYEKVKLSDIENENYKDDSVQTSRDFDFE